MKCDIHICDEKTYTHFGSCKCNINVNWFSVSWSVNSRSKISIIVQSSTALNDFNNMCGLQQREAQDDPESV